MFRGRMAHARHAQQRLPESRREGSYIFGIDISPSSQENQNYQQLSNASNWATGAGEGDILAGTNFMKGILSGDATKISQVLAPTISAAKTSAQQTNLTSAENGTRSGGTAATNATANDRAHSDIVSAIANLTGGAASGLTSAGGGLLGTGISGTQAAFGDAAKMQAQRAAQWNDIFQSISAVAGGIAGGFGGGGGASAPGVLNMAQNQNLGLSPTDVPLTETIQ